MRTVKNFLITRTTKHYHEIVEEGIDRGFVYPAPHVYAFKYEEYNSKERVQHVRGRPYSANCALVRDSSIASNSIGIMIYCPEGNKIHPDAVTLVSNIIRMIADDLGMKQFGILTDEVNDENHIDVLEFNTAVSKAPSIFNKRI